MEGVIYHRDTESTELRKKWENTDGIFFSVVISKILRSSVLFVSLW
jgi:hypothetical protein